MHTCLTCCQSMYDIPPVVDQLKDNSLLLLLSDRAVFIVLNCSGCCCCWSWVQTQDDFRSKGWKSWIQILMLISRSRTQMFREQITIHHLGCVISAGPAWRDNGKPLQIIQSPKKPFDSGCAGEGCKAQDQQVSTAMNMEATITLLFLARIVNHFWRGAIIKKGFPLQFFLFFYYIATFFFSSRGILLERFK